MTTRSMPSSGQPFQRRLISMCHLSTCPDWPPLREHQAALSVSHRLQVIVREQQAILRSALTARSTAQQLTSPS